MLGTVEIMNILAFWKKVGKKTEATYLLNPNSFVDIFQNNFINSKNNAQAFKSFNDKHVVCNDNIIQFGIEEIEKAVNSLNKSQACDCNGLNLFNILHAHPAIYVSLKKLFKIMLQFSIVPEAFGHSVITPVVKNKNRSINDANNYRPFSIFSIICKVFEACVLVHIEPMLTWHVNQFGFVQKGGCNKALFAFTSTKTYFVQRKSNVYFRGLDAAKAFDCINYFYLFSSIIDRGVSGCVVNTLHAWFSHMKACIKWGKNLSAYFSINTGVPDSSLLGPQLYNIVMDKLLFLLQNSGLG